MTAPNKLTLPDNLGDITLNVVPNCKPGRYLVVAAYEGKELSRNTFDLNSEHSRSRFVTRAEKCDLNGRADEFREHLGDRLLAYAKAPPGAPDPPPSTTNQLADDPRGEALARMPEDVKAEAERLLADSKLLERIIADIEAAGVVGERRLAATLYLAGVSVQLPRPLSAIVRGPSCSGKSYTAERVAGFFPPEVVLFATSITTNALYYFPPGALRHRLVIGGERSRLEDDDRAEATRALREMIESARLSKAVPVKEHDTITTKVIEQQGPISFIETTTLGAIFDEDANRCLLLATNEQEEQTRRILDATAAAAAGRSRPDLERRRDVHFALQRMLPRCEVLIPFAEQISALYPTDRLDARRSFRHLLQLVRASALLHFRQRERNSGGEVIATIEDYNLTERLARGPFSVAASGVSDGARQFLLALRNKFKEDEFSTSDAQKVGGGSRRTRYSRLKELNGVGAVEQTEAQRGAVPAKWRLTGIDADSGAVVPSAQAVCDRLLGCTLARSA
ncbi:MAG: hypothetical protein L0241_11095 [Planctomycetia bacterium]|nr:hypothetical protein [Planctomycetia bacterium]